MIEKYGVEETDNTKVGTEETSSRKCPACNDNLTEASQTNVKHCPKCGTKPFEGNNVPENH